MILNEFNPLSLSGIIKSLSFQLLVMGLFSCNKTSNISANKAFVSFTHYAYQVGPLTLKIGTTDVFSAVPFDSATGYPYGTVVSQVSNTSVMEESDTFLTGFSSFRQGAHYSIYAYDTIEAGTLAASAKSIIILQDNPPLNTDSTVSIRYMNFAPSSEIGLILINTRKGPPYNGDTTVINPALFVGLNPNPAAYKFQPILEGSYNIIAFADSARPAPGNSNFRQLGNFTFSITANYNVNLFGFANLDSGEYKLQLKNVPLN